MTTDTKDTKARHLWRPTDVDAANPWALGRTGTTADPTAPIRVARYKQRMRERGCLRVDVWVPTKADADEIRRIAAEMRDRGAVEKQTA
jgi:hypothetical protein